MEKVILAMFMLSTITRCTDIRIDYSLFSGKLKAKYSLDFNPLGIAISGDELFMMIPNSPHIEVYNIEPFAFQRTITVEGMSCPCDIVASENVLYVNELCDQLIHRIQLPGETMSTWKVNGIVFKLSIAKNGTVIVASRNSDKILEYTSGGTLVRKIKVGLSDNNVVGLQHAIQLDGDKFSHLSCPYKSRLHNRQHWKNDQMLRWKQRIWEGTVDLASPSGD